MKRKQPCTGFELGSPVPFPKMITVTPSTHLWKLAIFNVHTIVSISVLSFTNHQQLKRRYCLIRCSIFKPISLTLSLFTEVVQSGTNIAGTLHYNIFRNLSRGNYSKARGFWVYKIQLTCCRRHINLIRSSLTSLYQLTLTIILGTVNSLPRN